MNITEDDINVFINNFTDIFVLPLFVDKDLTQDMESLILRFRDSSNISILNF